MKFKVVKVNHANVVFVDEIETSLQDAINYAKKQIEDFHGSQAAEAVVVRDQNNKIVGAFKAEKQVRAVLCNDPFELEELLTADELNAIKQQEKSNGTMVFEEDEDSRNSARVVLSLPEWKKFVALAGIEDLSEW
jgi:hypothetical protein